jgi:hypothetical protein
MTRRIHMVINPASGQPKLVLYTPIDEGIVL